MAAQLELVERPLVFVTVCPYCGVAVAAVPVDDERDGDKAWHVAEAWSYLAQKQHERDCEPARWRQQQLPVGDRMHESWR